jgi:LysR family glycine cleavage system transcriptional activator
MDRSDWQLWFEAQGVPVPPHLKGPSFSDDHLLVRAAVSGQGLALVRDVYADGELSAGRLVLAITVTWPARFAYYAVTTPEALQRPAVRQFREWLIAEASKPSREP